MEQKIDRRRHYILVVDTETANTIVREDGSMDMSDVLVYDCGWAVVDKHGTVYETASFVNRDIFVYERELMRTAYYANKIPRYVEELREGSRVMASTYEIRQAMLEVLDKWNIRHVSAHNARFDSNGLNRTQSYTTTGRFRYWFPFGRVTWWDTMRMAQDVIVPMPTYVKFCQEHGYVLKNGKPRKTAEILYQFITGDTTFVESHTGLEDVLIEKEIMAYCFRQHKAMRKELYPNSGKSGGFAPQTDFQRQLMASLRECPTIRGMWA